MQYYHVCGLEYLVLQSKGVRTEDKLFKNYENFGSRSQMNLLKESKVTTRTTPLRKPFIYKLLGRYSRKIL